MRLRELLELAERPAFDLDAVGVAEALWLASHLDPSASEGGPPDADETDEWPGTQTGPEQTEPIADKPSVPAASASDSSIGTGAAATVPGSRTPGSEAEVRPVGAGGIEVRLPRARALPGAAAIQRAMRPLKRRVASRRESILDEVATVERYAETRILTPELRPARERWLEVALVVDEHESMLLWREVIEELAGVLVRLGAFRDVRIWGLDSGKGVVSIERRPRLGRRGGGERRPPQELVDPTGRRLILVLSDCVAPGWRSGAVVAEALAPWARSGPLALAQPLPPRLWPRTGLGRGRQVRLSSRLPGVANHLLTAMEPGGRFRPAQGGADSVPFSVVLPVLTLDEKSVGGWASLVAGKGHAVGWRLPTVGDDEPVRDEDRRPGGEERVRDFLRAATPNAKRLASFLAAAPLHLPVMRVVQRVMLPDSRQSHLAEVVLGGLMHRVSPPDASLDEIEYEFHAGVRDRLQSRALRHETLRVVEEVSGWLGRHRGVDTGFRAAVGEAGEALAQGDRPFARLTADVLRRLGGEAAEAADRIEAALGSEPSAAPSETSAQAPADAASTAPEASGIEEPEGQAEARDVPFDEREELAEPFRRRRRFDHLVSGLTSEFHGREDLFEAIETFRERHPSGVFQVVGPPESGKTTIVAEWVHRHRCPHYFWETGAGGDPGDLAYQLGAQLITGYGLLEKRRRPPPSSGGGTLSETAESVARDPERLDREALGRLARDAAIAGGSEPLLLAVDGPGGTGASELPLTELPENAMLLYTGPAELATGSLPSEVYRLEGDRQSIEIEGYLHAALADVPQEPMARLEERRQILSAVSDEITFLDAALTAARLRSSLYDPSPEIEERAVSTGRSALSASWSLLQARHAAEELGVLVRVAESPGPMSEDELAASEAEARVLREATELGLLVRTDSSSPPADSVLRYFCRHDSIARAIREWSIHAASPIGEGPQVLLEVFAPRLGESMLLRYGDEAAPNLVLFDGGGPGSFRRVLLPALEMLREEIVDDYTALPVELLVLTHMDDPQSRGILDLLDHLVELEERNEPPLVDIREFWFNGTSDPAEYETYPAERNQIRRERRLQDRLDQLGIACNERFQGSPVTVESAEEPIDLPGGLRAHVLSPRHDLVEWTWKRDRQEPNLASIAVLAEIAGRRLLLPSDARGDHVLEGLEYQGLLDDHGRIHVDLLKLPHHGSARSSDANFYQRVTADAYLVTGNERFELPDIEVLEWVVDSRKGQPKTVYFCPSPESHREPRSALLEYLEGVQSRSPEVEVVFADPDASSLTLDFTRTPGTGTTPA